MTRLRFSYLFYYAVVLTLITLLMPKAHADGVDEPLPPKYDVNYWRLFDKHPCRYNLGYNERLCVEKPDRYSWNKPENPPRITPTSIPEPEILGLFGVGLLAFITFKNWRL